MGLCIRSIGCAIVSIEFEKKDFEKILDNYLDRLADAVFTRSQENIVKEGISDTGQMLVTANINRKFLQKEIVYPAPQALWIEYGVEPHPVSTEGRKKIARWASRKLGLSAKEAEAASWGISKKIKLHGQE